MVKSYLNLLVRNRKVHFLVFVVALLTVVNQTLRGRGITINYTTDDPHSKELTYESISDNIKKGFFVTDMRIQRCLRGFSCSAPPNEQPGFWVKIPTKLNLYPHSFSMYNYYMYIEKTRGNESKRFVEDIQFSSKNEQPEKGKNSNAKWLSHKVASRSYIWIKYVENIDFAVRMVRDVNVLYGKHDMIDARKHWKFSPSPIQLPLKQLIQPKLSMLMVAVNDEMAIFNADQQFENVQKKNEIILTVDPNFKVLQISDMHIGQDSALCDGDQCKFDVKTLKFIENVIANEENVKFIFFTGDLIDFTRVKHFESAVLKALAPVLRAEIPFVFTFGDSEHEWSNPQTKINILNFISSLPGCYNKRPSQLDRRLHGLTNGNINVYRVPPAGGFEEFDYNKLKLEEPSAVLTYLDSEEMYVDETQSNYLYRISKRLANVDLKLLFFHNPLPNFRPQGKFKLIGSYNEKHQIETKSSRQFLKDVKECGYRAVCVGHEHENDSCIWDDKDDKEILLCYSSVAGESADTRLDKNFGRRLRVFDINFDKVEILSWKRLKGDKEQSEMIDPQSVWKAADPEPEFAKQDDQDNGEAPAKEAPMDKPVDKPAENKPAAEEPAKEPAAEKPAAEKPAAEKPAAEKPAAEKPAAEKPAAEKPAAEKPAAKKPAAEEAAEEPVAKNPAEEKPAAKQEAAAPAEDAAPAEAAAAPAKEAAAAPAEDAAAAPAEEAPAGDAEAAAGDAEAAAPVEKLEEEPAAEEPAVDAAAEPAVALEEAAP